MAGMTPVSRTARTTDLAPELRRRWAMTVTEARGAKGAEDPDPDPYAENLLARWDEPQRRYHTSHHLADVLHHIDELSDCALDLPAVQLAAWFHDAVYRPDRSENEERSAALAERALPELGVDAARTAEVARLVRLTITHDPAPDDLDGAVLCGLCRLRPRGVRVRTGPRLPCRPVRGTASTAVPATPVPDTARIRLVGAHRPPQPRHRTRPAERLSG
jgi:hypothetical protein